MVVGARESSQFCRQITSFIENNKAFSKFSDQIFYCLISIIEL